MDAKKQQTKTSNYWEDPKKEVYHCEYCDSKVYPSQYKIIRDGKLYCSFVCYIQLKQEIETSTK